MEPAMVDGNGTETAHIIVTTIDGRNGQPKQTISYRFGRIEGEGSSGVVFQAKSIEKNETVAIKRVLLEWFHKSEQQTMRLLNHPNVVSLKHCFFSKTKKDELFVNLVMEYVPKTVHQVIKRYKEKMPMIYVKLYAYQIVRALAYIHGSIGVYHGDIKPENLLVDTHTHQVKLCDFGHSGELEKGEPSYYPDEKLEDIWSAGCVLAELLLGEPFFRVERKAYQLHKITQFLENTTSERPWHEIFHERMPEEAVDLISKLLQDSPITGVEALIHPFFDELRDPNVRLPNGRFLPPLFDFKAHEVKGVTVEILEKLIPEHARKQCDIVW